MKRLAIVAFLAAPAVPVAACSLCNPDMLRSATFRQDAAQARLVLYGNVTRSDLVAGEGLSDIRIANVIKPDRWLGKKTAVKVPRYVPVADPKDPPKYLLFGDVHQDKLDVFRGVPVTSDAAAAYVKGLMALHGKPPADVLRYCFDWLEHPDKAVAQDAFLEFAKADDADIGRVAVKLAPEKLRRWLKDPATPEPRLGVYAFLLGACGTDEDAAFLRARLLSPADRDLAAFDGLLGGYIRLRPREGWDLALAVLKDRARPFAARFAVVRTLRFYRGWKPDETRDRVLAGMAEVLRQGDMADLAVEDLRRWGLWDLTDQVVALYGQKGYDAPLMRRSLTRYALTCPKPAAKRLAEDIRRRDPDTYRDVEESLAPR